MFKKLERTSSDINKFAKKLRKNRPDKSQEHSENSSKVELKKKHKNKGTSKEDRSERKKKKKKKEKEEEKEVKTEEEEDKDAREPQSFFKTPSNDNKLAYEHFVKSCLSMGVHPLLKEYHDQLKPYISPGAQREIFDQHPTKNRYKDVVCNDVTRVMINDGKGSDYIHANHVKGDSLYNDFICTQGPMHGTLVDFWRMIVHYKVSHIVMLCEVVEMGRTKCEQYWPKTTSDKMKFGDMTVSYIGTIGRNNHIVKTLLEVEVGGTTMRIKHHHWRTWPDRNIPKYIKPMMTILNQVRNSSRPVVVHCSAGIGRTGTFVAVEMCLQRLFTTNCLSLLEVCQKLRDQRMHCVQVEIQYAFLASAVISYGKECGYWDNPDLAKDFAKFKAEIESIARGGIHTHAHATPTPTTACAAQTCTATASTATEEKASPASPAAPSVPSPSPAAPAPAPHHPPGQAIYGVNANCTMLIPYNHTESRIDNCIHVDQSDEKLGTISPDPSHENTKKTNDIVAKVTGDLNETSAAPAIKAMKDKEKEVIPIGCHSAETIVNIAPPTQSPLKKTTTSIRR